MDQREAMTGMRIGSLRLVRQVSDRQRALVYEAIHEPTGRRATLLVLPADTGNAPPDPLAREAMLLRARTINRVNHPGIAELYDAGVADDSAIYAAWEYLDGETLLERMARVRRMGPEALQIARQIASAVSAAHDFDVTHGALDPSRVVLVADPDAVGGERAKVFGFGFPTAAALGDHPTNEVGLDVAPAAYLAPEQCLGEAIVDARVDTYALGAMMFEMFAGRRPFAATTAVGMRYHHIYDTPPRLTVVDRDVPDDHAALVAAMLAKEPRARPTIREVVERLERLGATPGTTGLIPIIWDEAGGAPGAPSTSPRASSLTAEAARPDRARVATPVDQSVGSPSAGVLGDAPRYDRDSEPVGHAARSAAPASPTGGVGGADPGMAPPRAATAGPVAGGRPAPPPSWWYDGLDLEALGHVIGLHQGRPARLSTYAVGGVRLYSTVIVKDLMPAWWWYVGLDAQGLMARVAEHGARIADLDTYIEAGARRFVAVLVRDGVAAWNYVGLDAQGLAERVAEHGARILDLDTYVDGETRRFAAVLARGSGEPWWWCVGLDAAALSRKLADHGARPVCLRSFADGGGRRFACVMVKNTSETWWWFSGIDADALRARIVDSSAYLVDLDAYVDDGGARFSAILYRAR